MNSFVVRVNTTEHAKSQSDHHRNPFVALQLLFRTIHSSFSKFTRQFLRVYVPFVAGRRRGAPFWINFYELCRMHIHILVLSRNGCGIVDEVVIMLFKRFNNNNNNRKNNHAFEKCHNKLVVSLQLCDKRAQCKTEMKTSFGNIVV